MDKKEEPQTGDTVGICNFCENIASLKCANCKVVFYCQKECQKSDWKKGHKDECRPVRIEKNSTLGRHLTVTRDFKAGELIFKEEPLVVGPKQITEPICLNCYKRVYGTYRCSKCTWPMCNAECEAGLEHQPECIVGQEIGSPIDIADFNETNHFYEVVLPVRCLALKKRSPKKYAQLLNLESHYEELKESEGFKENTDRIVNMLRNYFMLVNFLPEEMESSEYMIHRIVGILDTNAVDLPAGGREIAGLYSLFSMVEHSCTPNVRITFNRKKGIYIKAAVDLKKGDHLAAMYSHILWGTIARREHLKINKYFMCTCSRCSDPTELGTYFSALRCQDCGIGYLTSAAALDELADWICSNCNSTVPVAKVKEITLELGEIVDQVIANPSIKSLEDLIERKSTTLVHPNHFHLFASKHSLLQIYGRQSNVEEETMLKKEKLCKELIKVCTTLDPGMTRLSIYASVILYEYHLAIMARKRQPDGSAPSPQSIKKDISFAKALLQQCIALVIDAPDETMDGKLKEVAKMNLGELTELESNLP